MKVPFTLGEIGHFGLAVRDPKKSAKWFERALGLRKEFDFENGVAIGNDNVTGVSTRFVLGPNGGVPATGVSKVAEVPPPTIPPRHRSVHQ